MDECNFFLALDESMANEMRHLLPHKSVFDLNEPKAVSNGLSMPKPVIASISGWMHNPEKVNQDKLKKMSELTI